MNSSLPSSPGTSFEAALRAMDSSMNYEKYVQVDWERSVSKPVSQAPFLVQQMWAAMYDTLAAVDQIGRARHHLSAMLGFELSPSNDVKECYAQAQAHVREAMRYCEVLSLRRELVEFVSLVLTVRAGQRHREVFRRTVSQYRSHLLAGDKMLRKIVGAIGHDLARASRQAFEKPILPHTRH
jgi:hypothetical protein